jgi:hypothetical protein
MAAADASGFVISIRRGASTATLFRYMRGFGGGSEGSTRSEGYRLFRSNKINQLLAMATAESGTGYDGTVTKQESKSILSHLARGSDPQVRIKSIELLNKLEREEAALTANQPEETLEQTLGHIIICVPYQAVGAFLSLSSFISGGGFIAGTWCHKLPGPDLFKELQKRGVEGIDKSMGWQQLATIWVYSGYIFRF